MATNSKFPGYNNIKMFYDWGVYSKSELKDFVEMKRLTKAEYKKICNEDYVAKSK